MCNNCFNYNYLYWVELRVIRINSDFEFQLCILEQLVKIVQFDNDKAPVSADSLEPLWVNPCVTRN